MKNIDEFIIIKAYLTDDAGIHLRCRPKNSIQNVFCLYYDKKTKTWIETRYYYNPITKKEEEQLREYKEWITIKEIGIPVATDPQIPIPMGNVCREFECSIDKCEYINQSSYDHYNCIECAKCSICKEYKKKCEKMIEEKCRTCNHKQIVPSIKITECEKCRGQIIPEKLREEIKKMKIR